MGFSLAYGEDRNGFIGADLFALKGGGPHFADGMKEAKWMFDWAFAGELSTVTSIDRSSALIYTAFCWKIEHYISREAIRKIVCVSATQTNPYATCVMSCSGDLFAVRRRVISLHRGIDFREVDIPSLGRSADLPTTRCAVVVVYRDLTLTLTYVEITWFQNPSPFPLASETEPLVFLWWCCFSREKRRA